MKINSISQNSCLKSIQCKTNSQNNTSNVAFKGIEELVKEEGNAWKAQNGTSEINRIVSYHPFLDEKNDLKTNSLPSIKQEVVKYGHFTQIINTQTTLGEKMPVTQKEAKAIPYDVLLSIAKRLKKTVENNVRKQDIKQISDNALQDIGKRIKI